MLSSKILLPSCWKNFSLMEKHLWKLSKFYVSWTEYSAFTKVFSIVPFSEHACFEGFLPICSYGCSFPVHFRHHLFCGVSIYQFLSNYLCSFPPKRYTTKGLSMCLLKNFKGQIYRLVLSMVKKGYWSNLLVLFKVIFFTSTYYYIMECVNIKSTCKFDQKKL